MTSGRRCIVQRERYAQELKLNVFLVKRALAANTHKAGIEADTNLADTLKASGTPAPAKAENHRRRREHRMDFL